MTINEKTIKKWNELREHTDIAKIAIQSGISRVTISNAFRSKRASGTTIIAIDDYFKDKQKSLKKLTT